MGKQQIVPKKDALPGVAQKTPALKTIKIQHHHAKPYRKRHYAGLFVFLVFSVTLFWLAKTYSSQLSDAVASARQYISGSTVRQTDQKQVIDSIYGFSITYDPSTLYASALDTSSGDLFIAQELKVSRQYELIRLAPTLGGASTTNTNMTIHYYQNMAVKDAANLGAIETTAIKDITQKATLQAKKTGTSNVILGGKSFLKTDWLFSSNNKVFSGFTPSFTTYTSVLSGKPFVIEVINSGISGEKSFNYDEVLNSLSFGSAKTTLLKKQPGADVAMKKSRSLLDSVLFGQVASAASARAESLSSEKISSVYGPAVVKLFNVYCQDIYFDGSLAIKDACSGSTGSGFFINQSGYIASNGHVTSADPKDLLIQFAFTYFQKGDTKLLDFLASKANITTDQLPNGTTQERADYVFDRFYDLSPARVTVANSAVNLLVCLGKDQPDVKELIAVTNNRKLYAEQSNIKQAKPIAQDFRTIDGFVKFHASDVSIIKIEGEGYPVAKLGSIAALMQGADLSILGFPGNASDNGIVDAGTSTVTLTGGKVSAIKNALGSSKKLIETDTLIGHGNSGGPAFNASGEVMGISTYTATKVGDSTYNYVRDIQDLVDLASSASVAISPLSITQNEWELALAAFDTAHYSKALNGFLKVKQLYPAHPKADQFIAVSRQNIADGKDVKDMPIKTFIAVGVGLLIAAAGVVVFIVRHKKAHAVYRTHVAEGKMSPLAAGDKPQKVAYDPHHIRAQKNVHTMHHIAMAEIAKQPSKDTTEVDDSI